MQNFDQHVQEIQKFYSREQYVLALDKVNFLLRAGLGRFVDDEQSYLYEQKGLILHKLGEPEKAMQALKKALLVSNLLQNQKRLCSAYLFESHYVEGVSAKDMAQRHFLYERFFSGRIRQYTHQKRNRTKLRIGYLSPDYRQHIIAYFAIQMFACRNPERFEVIGYDLANSQDAAAKQLQTLSDGWHHIDGLTARQAAQKIYEDQIDILFDLAGHSEGGETLQIAAYKPAPVQISGIGYMSTTGLQAIDYFLTDVYCDPCGTNDAYFSEKLLRLPHSHFCYTPQQKAFFSLPEYQVRVPVVFGSFNNFSKITDSMLRVWGEILQRVPQSRLLLKNSRPMSLRERSQLRKRAELAGIDGRRLEIRACSNDYLMEYPEVDIALDTYPYPGGGTTCEALYMGVPVITLEGERHGARFGYSLLRNVGIAELSARDLSEYRDKAVALAGDAVLLKLLHDNLRTMMKDSPVMDGKNYIRELEEAYENIWQKWLKE